MVRRIALIAALVAVASLAPARALGTPVVAVVYFQYVPGQLGGPVDVIEGSSLLLSNQDVFATQYIVWHDITSFALDEHRDPLFASPSLGYGETASVDGVERLAPGTYPFYCGSHGESLMRGELIVHPAPV